MYNHFSILFYFSANISLVICDTCKKVQEMFDKYEETPNLKTIVVMEELSLDLQTKAQQLGIKLLSFSDLEVSSLHL